MKVRLWTILLIVAVTLGTACAIALLRHESPVGNWKGDGLTLSIKADHHLYARRIDPTIPDGDYRGSTTHWSDTNDGIKIDQSLWYEHMGSHYYRCEFAHNGNTLKMTSTEGAVLSFERSH